MTRGYEPGRAITPRVSPSPQPLAFLAFAGKLGAGANSWERNRTINWKRDVCYLTPSFLAGGACQARHPSPASIPSSSRARTRYASRDEARVFRIRMFPRSQTSGAVGFFAVRCGESGFSLPVFGSFLSFLAAGELLSISLHSIRELFRAG